MCEALPDSSRRAGEWIVLWVDPSKDKVDYLVISHLHNDHTGDRTNEAIRTAGRNLDYVLTGIAEVDEYIHFKKVIDRGWLDYQYPLPVNDLDVDNFRAYVNWKIKNDRLIPESFDIGCTDQIVLLNDKETYNGSFRIWNLAASGQIWTRHGREKISYYDLLSGKKEGVQNENTKSISGCAYNKGLFLIIRREI